MALATIFGWRTHRQSRVAPCLRATASRARGGDSAGRSAEWGCVSIPPPPISVSATRLAAHAEFRKATLLPTMLCRMRS